MIYTVTLNPALDKTARIDGLEIDAVNRISELRADPGGKGLNVSKVIAKMGGKSKALALLGGNVGNDILRMVGELGVDCQAFEAPGETRTNLKIVDTVHHTNTDINEPGPKVDAVVLDGMLSELKAAVVPDDIVVLAGSLPKGAAVDTYARWINALSPAGARVFLDADGIALVKAIDAGPFLIKPNDHELEELVGRPLPTIDDLISAASELQDGGVSNVVVSLGGSGALFLLGGQTVLAKAPKVKVESTVGAGDSVVAALALACEKGLSPKEAARLAVATGSANVMSAGTQAAEAGLVEALLDKVEVEAVG